MFVQFAQLCFNTKFSELTGSTPFSLMFGRNINELKDYSYQEPIQAIDIKQWKEYQEKVISLVFPAVSDRILINKNKMIKSLNKQRRILTDQSIPAGAIVMLKDPIRQNKFEPKYIGPFTVIRRSHNGTYVLRDATGDILDRHVPADQLKLIRKKPQRVDISKQVFEVDKILQHRGTPGNFEYLIKWKHYPIADATWEPETSILDNQCVTNYWKEYRDNNNQ
jgi:hypothetical protein